MKLSLLSKIITPFFKGCFSLPMLKDPDKKLIHLVGVSSGLDSTTTALVLKVLFPDVKFVYVFTDTGFEVDGTEAALQKLEAFLGQPILRPSSPYDFMTTIKMASKDGNGSFIPSQRQRWCTQVLKIMPFQAFIEQLRLSCDTEVEFATYTGIRADEPTRTGASFSGDTGNYFPLQALGLDKTAVNTIVERTLGIPLYYQEKSRSGCAICIYSRRSEIIAAWRTSTALVQQAAAFETHPDKITAILNDLPPLVSSSIGEGRNHIGFPRPDWLGYPTIGSQGKRGKNARKETLDMFSAKSKHLYAAVEYEYHSGIPGLALPQVYFERFITYSTSLGGLKIALKHFWLHRLQTKELHQQDSEAAMRENKQMAIVQIEVDDFEQLVPEKPEGTFTWQGDGKSLLAIRKTSAIIEHILLCEGLRQDNHPGIDNVPHEYGRILHFSQYEQPSHEDLVDDFDIEDAPVMCNACAR
jgi:3'-phosphoadenosine 5'-phosphosulfate sulfotransferase (PAPS reductase)/FAD synthetase